VVAISFRSCALAESDSLCTSAGSGDFHSRLCRWDWHNLQDGSREPHRRGPEYFEHASVAGFHQRHQFHFAATGIKPDHSEVRHRSPEEAHGSLNDPNIQQLLLYAARNNFNAGVRMDSVDLLTQQPNNQHVREALLYALRYDSNTGVRLKALDGLGPYVKDDVQVRDAVLESLMSDSNPGVRIEALHLLEPVRADSSVRIVLQKLAAKDDNRYIRSQARSMIAQSPEMN
jgi:HEAT repeats